MVDEWGLRLFMVGAVLQVVEPLLAIRDEKRWKRDHGNKPLPYRYTRTSHVLRALSLAAYLGAAIFMFT